MCPYATARPNSRAASFVSLVRYASPIHEEVDEHALGERVAAARPCNRTASVASFATPLPHAKHQSRADCAVEKMRVKDCEINIIL